MEITSLLKRLRGQTVCLDTMIFIYAFEEHPTYLPFLKTFFLSVEKGGIEAVTSTITITECMVQPYRKNNFSLAAHYMALFRNFPHLSVIPVTDEIAERAGFLRARYNVKTPDAVQLATTLVSGSRFFLTNDADLPSVEGVQILILERLS